MKTETQDLTDLDNFLADRWLSGLWKLDRHERTADPKTKVVPHLWKWDDVYESLLQTRTASASRRGVPNAAPSGSSTRECSTSR